MNTLTKNDSDNALGFLGDLMGIVRVNRFIQILLGVFILQCLLAIVMTIRTSTLSSVAPSQSLISASVEAIEKIEIVGENDNAISLISSSGQWQIEGELGLPVQANKVESFLGKVTSLKTGLSVANSENAREQLRVSHDDYLRHVTFSGQDMEPTTLLLGTSPGLRKSHIRRADSNDIFSASLPVSDLPLSRDSWMDKTLLSVDDVQSVSSGALRFSLQGNGEDAKWSVDETGDTSQEIDSAKIASTVTVLQNLRVEGVVEIDSDTGGDVAAEATVITVTSGDSVTRTLTLMKKEDKWTITRDDVKGVFSLSSTVYDQLITLTSLDNFVVHQNDNKSTQSTAKE